MWLVCQATHRVRHSLASVVEGTMDHMYVPPHILVVDDEVVLLALYVDALTGAGYRVTTCATIAAAQAQLDQARPDCLILDLYFHRAPTGRAWLLMLAQTPATAALPVVVCSAARAELAALAAVALPSWQLLAKPFDLDVLLRCLPPVRCQAVGR